MPIYEYACARCGAEKEILHGISEQPQIECEHCKGEHLQRLVSAAGFRLKGGGWYETDFKAGGKRNVTGDAKSDSSDAKPSTGDSGKDKDTAKPAADSAASSSAGSAAA